jgi:DNA-binding MurR/RpiR family transcriptional regulator
MNTSESQLMCGAMTARIGKKYMRLSKAQKKAAEYVLSNVFLSATMTIDEMANAAGISIATANRFAKTLEFDGYPQFRAELINDFKSMFVPALDPRLAIQHPACSNDLIAFAMDEQMENLESTRRSMVPELCNQAVQMILRAERIYIVGYGVDAFFGGVMAHALESSCKTIQSTLDSGGFSHAARQLSKYTESDLVIAISFSECTEDVLTLLRQLDEKKIPILALTDMANSPLGSIANLTLYSSTQHHVLPNLKGAVLCFIEAICRAVIYQEEKLLQTV